MTKARTGSPNGYINSLRNDFITREQRTITRLKNLAQTTITPTAYPQAEIQNSQKWALEIIRYEEGLLESIYRNLIDDKERLRKAESLAEKRRQDIINSHNSAIETYNQKITEISKALEDYPTLEATLSVRTDDYVNKQLSSLATSGQIRIASDRLLRAYQLGLVNGDNKFSNRQDNETYDQLRNFIKAQDGHACVICHKTSSKSELHVHHIIPLSHYGTNQHVNLVTLCLTCHKKQHADFEITKDKPQKSGYRQQDNTFIALSIKTTGNLETDDIIEVTATRFINGVNKSRFQSYVYSDCYKPEFSGSIAGISKQTILSAEKPLIVFEKLLTFIGEANLVFHNAKNVLNFFNNYPSIYQSLTRRSITDIFKISEQRKIDLKDNQLITLLESLKSHTNFSYYTDKEDSINIGLAFIALSKTATKQPDKQTPTVSTRPRTNPSATNLESKPISQPEETMDYAFQLCQKKQYPQAFSIYRRFAKEGNANAQYNLGVMYANAQGVKKNDQHAVYCYQKAAEQGYAEAQNNLGVSYANGRGVEKDDQKAVLWFRKAADQGYAAAQYNLGVRYANGLGIERDDQKAVIWYQKAAEQGYVTAQYNLGVSYANGQGIEKDNQKAVLWYRKAADQGYAEAQNNLGWMYVNGLGIEKDDQKAVFWYRKAADQGYAAAQYNLGWRYANGRGVEKDNQKAVLWYRKAADQGHAEAQSNLGVMYANGFGIEKDDQKAVFWYRKAADQGYAAAQYNLGVRYANGLGIEKDDQKALFWYRKAAEQGNETAKVYFIKLYKDQQSEMSNETLIDIYHEALAFGDLLAANICYKMLFEHSCSRLSNRIYFDNSLVFKNPKEVIDEYHEALAFGDLETAKNIYIELDKYQRNRFRNKLANHSMINSKSSKPFDEQLDEYHESICYGDLENAFELFQLLIESKLNEIIKLGLKPTSM